MIIKRGKREGKIKVTVLLKLIANGFGPGIILPFCKVSATDYIKQREKGMHIPDYFLGVSTIRAFWILMPIIWIYALN